MWRMNAVFAVFFVIVSRGWFLVVLCFQALFARIFDRPFVAGPFDRFLQTSGLGSLVVLV